MIRPATTAPTRHLVIGGSLDGHWITDSIGRGDAVKVAPGNREAWRVVRFRLGRAIDRHVWILRGMTEAEAFDAMCSHYPKLIVLGTRGLSSEGESND